MLQNELGFRNTTIAFKILVPIMVIMIIVLRMAWPEREIMISGWRAVWDDLFSLFLLLSIGLLAIGIGRRLLRKIGLIDFIWVDFHLFAIGVGLVVISYEIFLLGILGFLQPVIILFIIVITGCICFKDCTNFLVELLPKLRYSLDRVVKGIKDRPILILALLGLVIYFSFLVIESLAPPTDYDGLMYHLPGPQVFLQMHQIKFLPGFWAANFPFTIEMLFAIGLAFGSDAFARLLIFLFYLLFLGSTYTFVRRFFGKLEACVSVGILIGTPYFFTAATWAQVDIPLAFYTTLALSAFFLSDQKRKYLLLSGTFLGTALAIKYLGLLSLLSVGVLFVFFRKQSPSEWVKDAITIAIPIVIVASPWYIKNLLLAGNPVYPYFLGGPGFNNQRLLLMSSTLNSMGTGTSWMDFLLIPVTLYTQRKVFAITLYEFISFLFPFSLFAPFFHLNKMMWRIIIFSITFICIWALILRQTRFLLPVFPILSLLASIGLVGIIRYLMPRLWKAGLIIILGGVFLSTLIYQVIEFSKDQPYQVVLGIESKDAYLQRVLSGYSTFNYIREELPLNARILVMWDGRNYYCGQRCITLANQDYWTLLVLNNPQPNKMIARLRELGITHLVFSKGDIDWLISENHDLTKSHMRAKEFFLEEFMPVCTKPVYESIDSYSTLFEFTCR